MTRRISPAIQTERHHLKRLLTACAHLTSAGQRSAHLRTRFAHERRLRVRVGDFHCYAALSDAGEPVRGGGGGTGQRRALPRCPSRLCIQHLRTGQFQAPPFAAVPPVKIKPEDATAASSLRSRREPRRGLVHPTRAATPESGEARGERRSSPRGERRWSPPPRESLTVRL